MNKSWIGVGVLGCVLAAYVVFETRKMQSIDARLLAIESQLSAVESVDPSRGVPKEDGNQLLPLEPVMELQPPIELAGESEGGAVKVDPEVLRQAIQQERMNERQQRNDERIERVTQYQKEMTSELAGQFGWTQQQEADALSILQDTMARGMELRDQVRDGEIERREARDLRDELRLELEERLEDVVGVEGMEAVFERIPGRRGR